MKNKLVNVVTAFKSLQSVTKRSQILVIAFLIYLVSYLLANSSFAIYNLFDGGIGYSDFTDFFEYDNFLLVIALLMVYFSISKGNFSSVSERETFLFSSVFTIFLFHYILNFFFIQRLVELRSPVINSLPNSVTDFLPFNWLSLSWNYNNLLEGYGSGWNSIDLGFTIVSVISILTVIFILGSYLKSSKHHLKDVVIFKNLTSLFQSTNRKVFIVVLTVMFVFIGIENTKARDYSTISMEAEFIQDDFKEFQDELVLANQRTSELDKYEARKAAASKAFGATSGKSIRLDFLDLSLWSSNLRVLEAGVVEWFGLWQVFLKEMSLKGYVEPETVFDLNQKYSEVADLGEFRAPPFSEEYEIEFWQDEFVTLVS